MRKIVSMFIALMILISMSAAYTLKVTVDGIDLEVTREPGNVIKLNEKIAEIKGWDVKTGNVTIVNNEFVMPEEDVVIEAILYEEPNKYLLTVENLFARTRERKFEGQSVTVEATSYDGYNFLSWIASGIELTEEQKKSSTITFTMPGQEVALEAIYEIITLSWDTTGQLTKTLKLKSTDTTIIDWGDGTKETYAASPEEEQTVTHTYASAQNYDVKIGGDNNITHFWCPNNQISALNIDGASNLVFIDCGINNLTALNTNNNTELIDLWIGENQINSVDLSNNTKVEVLYANQNNLSEIDVSNNAALRIFTCNKNNLSEINLDNNLALTSFNCEYNNDNLTQVDLTNNTELVSLSIGNSKISSVDLSNNTKLTYLGADGAKLTSIDLSNNTKLTQAHISNNNFTALDVTNNIALTNLSFANNQVSSIDVSKNTELISLWTGGNPLTSLDISANTKLQTLNAYNNQLTELDISNNTSISSVNCYQTTLITLYVSSTQNSNLSVVNSSQVNALSNNTIYKAESTTVSIK